MSRSHVRGRAPITRSRAKKAGIDMEDIGKENQTSASYSSNQSQRSPSKHESTLRGGNSPDKLNTSVISDIDVEGFSPRRQSDDSSVSDIHGSPVRRKNRERSTSSGTQEVDGSPRLSPVDVKKSKLLERSPTSEIKKPRKTEEQETRKTVSGSHHHGNKYFGLICVSCAVVFILIVAIIFQHVRGGPLKEKTVEEATDMATDFTNSFRQLQKSYPGLSKRFWKICGAPIYSVMQSPAPSQPAVILIAIPPERYRQGEEIAHQLSKIYPGKAEPVYINSTDYNSTDPDSAKLDIDTMLNDGFGKGSKAAVLYSLEEIPPPAMLIFYKYCDNENAPYKDAVIIFTVNLPEPISEDLNNQEQEKAVQEFLRSKWEGRADLDIDKIGALFSRIANSVAIMNTEYNPNPMI